MKHFLTTALLCGTAILAAQAQNVIVTDKDGIPHKYNADYVQEITFEKIGTPEPEVFDRVSVTPYGDKCFMLQLFRDNFLVQLELYQPSAYFLQPGQYVVRSKNEQGGYDDFSINKDWYWIGDYPDEQLQMTLTGGTLDVELDDDVYTMALDLAFEDDKKIVGTYSGTINKFGPTLNYNLTNCRSVDFN